MVPGRHEPRHGLTGICRTGECHCSADRVHRRSSPRCAVGAPRSVTYYTRNYFVCKLIGRLYRWYSLPDAWNINVWFRAVIVQKQGVKILDTTAWRRRSSLPVGTFRIFRPGVFPRNGILSSIRGRHVHGSGKDRGRRDPGSLFRQSGESASARLLFQSPVTVQDSPAAAPSAPTAAEPKITLIIEILPL